MSTTPDSQTKEKTSSSRIARIALPLLTAATILACAACGSGSNVTQTKQQGERSIKSQSAEDKTVTATADEQTGTPKRPIVIGNDYASLSWIAASANTPGVWAWDASATDARVWHWAPGQEAASWSLGSTPAVREGVENPALAACGDSAWFGINDTLFKLTAADGIVAKVAVPHGEAIAAVETHRPNGVKGTSAVNAVACNGTTVAVGRSNSQVAFVYDTSTKKFRTVQLPEAAAVVDVAVNAKGVAAFALQDFNGKGPHTVVMATADGNVTTVDAPDSSTITAVGSDFRVGVKGDLLRVDADHGSAAFDPSAQTLAAVPGISPETPFVWLDATHYAYANDKGVKVGTLGKSTTDSLDLGTDTCPAISEPFNPHSPLSSSTTPSGAPTSCAITAGALAVDAEGTIYAALVGKRYVTRLTTKPRR